MSQAANSFKMLNDLQSCSTVRASPRREGMKLNKFVISRAAIERELCSWSIIETQVGW